MSNNKYKILVVEDEREIADAIEIYLKNQNYHHESWNPQHIPLNTQFYYTHIILLEIINHNLHILSISNLQCNIFISNKKYSCYRSNNFIRLQLQFVMNSHFKTIKSYSYLNLNSLLIPFKCDSILTLYYSTVKIYNYYNSWCQYSQIYLPNKINTFNFNITYNNLIPSFIHTF